MSEEPDGGGGGLLIAMALGFVFLGWMMTQPNPGAVEACTAKGQTYTECYRVIYRLETKP